MPIHFHPPLLNSANPWATSKKDLQDLFECPYIGAITTRTCLSGSDGFKHDDNVHQHCFVGTQSHTIRGHSQQPSQQTNTSKEAISSLNTYGYSPYSIKQYCQWIEEILIAKHDRFPRKAIIVSVASPDPEVDLPKQYTKILETYTRLLSKHHISCKIYMEINLSCPNIEGKPPPAYSQTELLKHLHVLSSVQAQHHHHKHHPGQPTPNIIECGIKTSPYTHQTQFNDLISALLASTTPPTTDNSNNNDPNATKSKLQCPITFITAINTLGSCLVFTSSSSSSSSAPNIITPALTSSNGTGIGGLAGAALHPLALGNVATLRRLLDEHDSLKQIEIIGVGGVGDIAGYERMRAVGAAAVGVGTALGVHGVDVFKQIWDH